MVSHKSVSTIIEKLETSQRAMERKMLSVKLKDRIRNIIIWQRTRVTDIVQYVAIMKWKWAGHIAWMKDNRWTIRSTEWQTEGVRSAGRLKRLWRDDIVEQQGVVWTRIAKDRESWTLVEDYFVQRKDTALNVIELHGKTLILDIMHRVIHPRFS